MDKIIAEEPPHVKATKMREIVQAELDHIPKGHGAQNDLRSIYWNKRLNGLAYGRDKKEALQEALSILKSQKPDFKPEYDKEFFKA